MKEIKIKIDGDKISIKYGYDEPITPLQENAIHAEAFELFADAIRRERTKVLNCVNWGGDKNRLQIEGEFVDP